MGFSAMSHMLILMIISIIMCCFGRVLYKHSWRAAARDASLEYPSLHVRDGLTDLPCMNMPCRNMQPSFNKSRATLHCSLQLFTPDEDPTVHQDVPEVVALRNHILHHCKVQAVTFLGHHNMNACIGLRGLAWICLHYIMLPWTMPLSSCWSQTSTTAVSCPLPPRLLG